MGKDFADKAMLIVLFFFFTNWGYAQKERIIEMKGEDRIIFPRSDYKLKIIDARLDTSYIGYVLNGTTYESQYIRFERPLSTTLQSIIRYSNHHDDAPTLYLKLLNLQVSEFKTSGIVSKCEIVADHIVDDYSSLKLIGQSSFVISKTGSQGVSALKKNVIEVIQKVINEFNSNDFQGLDISIDRSDLLKSGNYLNIVYSIEDPDKTFEPGLYASVLEFRNNDPAVRDGYIVDWSPISTRDNLNVKVRSKSDKRIIKDLWGFSDGRNCFINLGGTYHILDITENRDTFKFNIDARFYNATPGLVGGMMGGAIGGLLGGTIAALTAKRDTFEFQIDLTTGNFELLNGEPEPPGEPIIIYLLRNSKPKFTIPYKVKMDDFQIGDLEDHKSMVAFEMLPRADSILISISDGIREEDIQFHVLPNKDLYFILEEQNEPIEIRELDEEQASYHRAIVEKYVRKKN